MHRCGNHKAARGGTLVAVCGTLAAGALWHVPAVAAGTVAGTTIRNTATATFDLPSGGQSTISSNDVDIRVDELLDVAVASADPGDVVAAPGATLQVLSFTLTNAGNGSERFSLVAQPSAGGDFDPTITGLVLDADGNGAYDPGVDTAYVAGTNDPDLAPDASIAVFVLSTIPAGATDGQRGPVDLRATAATGSGAPGTSFAGQGQGGGNAIVGATGASATAIGTFVVAAANVSLAKTAQVADPFGQTSPVPGAIITYTLTATVSGSGSLANLRVNDPIPAGSSYGAGSLTLDGAPLTDADDGDAGRFTGTGIAVALGTVAAGTTHTITFRVRID